TTTTTTTSIHEKLDEKELLPCLGHISTNKSKSASNDMKACYNGKTWVHIFSGKAVTLLPIETHMNSDK
ncbi:hypothetical protein M8C21_031392, partial [Ambrosia artemisiifolia]